MEINLKQIGAWLIETGLMEKPFREFKEEEILNFCEQIHEATQNTDFSPPYIENDELFIPWNTHPRHKYWTKKGQPLKKTLEEIGASSSCIERYAPKKDQEGLPINQPETAGKIK